MVHVFMSDITPSVRPPIPPAKVQYPAGSAGAQVLSILVEVSGIEEVRQNLDLRLYDRCILDSMNTVELILALSNRFGVDISPTEFDREQWATPRLIITSIEGRIGR